MITKSMEPSLLNTLSRVSSSYLHRGSGKHFAIRACRAFGVRSCGQCVTCTDVSQRLQSILLIRTGQALAAIIWRLLWRLWFHPLARYPGPTVAAVSNLPYVIWTVSGNVHQRLRELHDRYGEVVRIRPNSLTYRSPQAWKDIYGHRKPGALPFSKDPEFYMPAEPGKSHLINANEADHSRQKRLLTHAFSERALRDQEPLIISYIDLFIKQLQGYADREEKVNLEAWLNFLTFDIVGDLAFGVPFGCLEGSEYHPWVATIFHSIKTGAFLRALSVYPFVAAQVRKVMPKRLLQRRLAHYQMSKDKVTQRLATTTARPDFISYILRYNDERGMQQSEIEVNASIIIQAGSETTATVLAACVYYLQKHPPCWQRATQEVRTAFQADSDITFLATSQLPYLGSIIEESLRMFPPAPGIGPRLVPKGGATIDRRFVPEGVRLLPSADFLMKSLAKLPKILTAAYRCPYPSHISPPSEDIRILLIQIHSSQNGG